MDAPPQPERKIAELFLRQNPPNFTGTGSPAEAEEWVRAIEKIFKFLKCTDQECLLCISFLLKGHADFWWEARQKTLTPDQLANFTWERFKEELYAKFIPRSYRKQKEIEFLNLKQGRRSVAEYDREFYNLARYAPYRVETDEKMAELFRSGLRQEIRVILAAQPPMSYTETLNRALDMEMEIQMDKAVTESNLEPAVSQVSPGSFQGNQKFKGKRKWESKEVSSEKQMQGQGSQSQGSYLSSSQKQIQPSQDQLGTPLCPHCNRSHAGSKCKWSSGSCFTCGQSGHYSFNCPQRQKLAGSGGRTRISRSSQPSKTYAVDGKEAKRNIGNQ